MYVSDPRVNKSAIQLPPLCAGKPPASCYATQLPRIAEKQIPKERDMAKFNIPSLELNSRHYT